MTLDREQMETLAEAVQLAVNWSIDDVDDETSVKITIEEDDAEEERLRALEEAP
jgi:hypothetical protein